MMLNLVPPQHTHTHTSSSLSWHAGCAAARKENSLKPPADSGPQSHSHSLPSSSISLENGRQSSVFPEWAGPAGCVPHGPPCCNQGTSPLRSPPPNGARGFQLFHHTHRCLQNRLNRPAGSGPQNPPQPNRGSRVGHSSALLARAASHSSKGTYAAAEMVLEVTRGSLSAPCTG